MIILPRPLRAYRDETLISFTNRAARHANLPARTIYTALGHLDLRLAHRHWAHVNHAFMPRLAAMTHQPEHRLRERLTEWTEGLPAGRRFPLAPPHELVIMGQTCAACSAAKDGATFSSTSTVLDHICLRHQVWTINHTQALTPACPDSVAAARAFHRQRIQRPRPRQLAAFESAYDAIRRIHPLQPSYPALEQVWDRRLAHHPNAPKLTAYYPEVARLATSLLRLPVLDLERSGPRRTHTLRQRVLFVLGSTTGGAPTEARPSRQSDRRHNGRVSL